MAESALERVKRLLADVLGTANPTREAILEAARDPTLKPSVDTVFRQAGLPPVAEPAVFETPIYPPALSRSLDAIRRSGLSPAPAARITVGEDWTRAGQGDRGTVAQVERAITDPQQITIRPDIAAGYEIPEAVVGEKLLHELSHVGELSQMNEAERADLIRRERALPYVQRPEEIRAIAEAQRLAPAVSWIDEWLTRTEKYREP